MKINKIWFLVLFLIFSSFFLTSCRHYSKSTDPHKYLEFELLPDNTYAVIGFSDRDVKNVVIPAFHLGKAVSTIKEGAFKMEVTFFGEMNLPIETLVIEEGVKTIESEAFHDRGLVSVKLAESIESIDDEAFCGNNAEINLPDGIKTIGSNAFNQTKLSGAIEVGDIELDDDALSGTDITSIVFPDTMTVIPEGICSGCDLLSQVEFPNGLIEIGSHAFKRCLSLTSVDLPETLEIIGLSAFEESGLTELVLKNELTELRSFSFAYCEQLHKVEFPNQYFSLERNAFGYCPILNQVIFGKSLVDYGGAFHFCPLANMSVVEDSVYEIVQGCLAFNQDGEYELVLGVGNFENFELFSSIGESAFVGRNFTDLNIGANIGFIASNAFYQSVIGEANIAAEVIAREAFSYASISKLTISSKEIGINAFKDVKDLTELVIGEGCEIIDREAFSCCFDLEKAYLPASLKEIKTGAFIQCHKLTEVFYGLTEGTPVRMYAGNFIEYISSQENQDGTIDVKLNDDFQIFVYEGVYSECIKTWDDTPEGEKFVYHENLVDFIKLR